MKRLTEKKYQELLKSNDINQVVGGFYHVSNMLGKEYRTYSVTERFVKLEIMFLSLRGRIRKLHDFQSDIEGVWYYSFGWVTIEDCIC